MIIDTHTHLFVKQFDKDRDETVRRAKDVGVEKFLLPNIDSSTIDRLLRTADAYPGEMFPMMGLHPTSVKENYREELARIEKALSERPYYGIGEIGMDFYWDTAFAKEQEEVFRTQLNWAKELDLPVSIHIRETFPQVLRILREEQDGRLRGVLHCFTGTYEQALEALDLNMWLGIGGVVTFKNGKIDRFLDRIPVERLVVETDAPWLTPAPYRGKRNEPAYIKFIVDKLAEIYGTTPKEIACLTTHNAMDVFGELE
ncbi:MAG: TatD family hydrolase [Chlorobi bacterium]|nr:TatD family hydrolase [Chlorobiota bacterium]